MANYIVEGPLEIDLEVTKRRNNVKVLKCNVKKALEETHGALKKGCYVYATRGPRGFRPIYVGKTKTTLVKECANVRNLRLVEHYLGDNFVRPKLVLFLISAEGALARGINSQIDEMEKALIALADQVNPDLINIQNRPQAERWSISGVYNSDNRKGGNAASEFRACLSIG